MSFSYGANEKCFDEKAFLEPNKKKLQMFGFQKERFLKTFFNFFWFHNVHEQIHHLTPSYGYWFGALCS